MNTEFNWLATILYPFLSIIVPILISWGGYALKKWLDSKYNKEQLQRALMIAEVVCSAVEQMANKFGWDSSAKFEQAFAKVKEWATKEGIKFTDEQWQLIIENIVMAFSEIWKKLKEDPTPKVEPELIGINELPKADVPPLPMN